MENIKAKAGQNLVFEDHKNKISDQSKDLLRRLLEIDPDRRIDWENFFNHPCFTQGSSSTPNNQIEQEFAQNRHDVGPAENQSFQDPLSMNIRKQAETVSDSHPSYEQSPYFKEAMLRYLHEKNKVLLIYLTVKKLRQLMKDPDYYEVSRYIYLLILILAKKGSLLSELNLYSLRNQNNNIFKLQMFEQFCANSEEGARVRSLLEEDQKIIFGYHNYVMGLKEEVNLTPEDHDILVWLHENGNNLEQLDDKATFVYHQIQDHPKPVKLSFNAEENRRYLLSMYLVQLAIKTEQLLPYVDQEGRKLEWQSLKGRLETMNPEMLTQAIFAIRN